MHYCRPWNWSRHSLRNVYTFPLLISVGSGLDSIVCGSLSNAVSGPGLDITWEVDVSVSEHWLWFSDGSGLNLTFLMKKLSIVLFIFSHHPRLHQLCLSDGPRLLTSVCLTAAHAFSNVHTRTEISRPLPIGGRSQSLIGLDYDMGLMCDCYWTTDFQSRRDFFFPSNSWSHRCDLRFFAPLRN